MLTESFNKLDLQIKPFEVSRKVALTKKDSRFYTGKLCKHNHRSLRRSSCGTCLECDSSPAVKARRKRYWKNRPEEQVQRHRTANREYARQHKEEMAAYAKKYREENPEKVREYREAYYSEHKESILEKTRAKYYENRESRLAQIADWKECNQERVKRKTAEHYLRNKEKFLMKDARRRAAKIQANVSLTGGLGRINTLMIRFIYEHSIYLSSVTGVPHEVDHIIPLNGKTVRGLHVWYNLRVITQQANRAKSNKIEEGLCQTYF